ncbi:MAG: hypothetical protein WCT53_00055 [Candidatus Gracilibacteria bacterium]
MKDVLSLKQAINATIHYFDLFNCPLRVSEIEEFLFGWSAPREVIEANLHEMPEISCREGMYFLVGREDIVWEKRERLLHSKLLWEKVKKYRFIFRMCPFIKMVAVFNALSFDNAKEGSDIDLLIVADDKKFATARFFVKAFTQIFKMRVHHENIAGRFCLSFFVSTKRMNLEQLSYDFDPHLAYLVKSAVPILGEDAYKDWLETNNKWTSRYFKRNLSPRKFKFSRATPAEFFASLVGKILELFIMIFGDRVEKLCAKYLAKREGAHKERTQKKIGIVMDAGVFKFHENDTRRSVAEQFLKRLALL